MTTPDAVKLYASGFLAVHRALGPGFDARTLAGPSRLMLAHEQRYRASMQQLLGVPPCDQLNDLWSSFDLAEPVPVCGDTATTR